MWVSFWELTSSWVRGQIGYPFCNLNLLHLQRAKPNPMRLLVVLEFLNNVWRLGNEHSWASASRPMPPASAFQHPVSQSGTGAFWYWTGSSYPGTRLVLSSVFLFIPVPDWSDAGQPATDKNVHLAHPHYKRWTGIQPTYVHTAGGERVALHVHIAGSETEYTLHFLTAGGVNGYTLHSHAAGCEKGYTLHARPYFWQRWWWKRDPASTNWRWWKVIHLACCYWCY